MQNNSRKSNSADQYTSPVVPTGGVILPDGTVFELVADPPDPQGVALLKSEGAEVEVSKQFRYQGATFVPLTMPESVRRAVRLPAGDLSGRAPDSHYADVRELLKDATTVRGPGLEILAGFPFLSWIADLLPFPLTLMLSAPDLAAGVQILKLLGALCRLPVVIAGLDAQDLDMLPSGLPATLLLLRPAANKRSVEALSVSGWRGVEVCRGGELVEAVGAKAIVYDTFLGGQMSPGPSMMIPVPPGSRNLPVINEQILDNIAQDFVPGFLSFRLERSRLAAQKPQADARQTASALKENAQAPAAPAPSSSGGSSTYFSQLLGSIPEPNGRIDEVIAKILEDASPEETPDPRTLAVEVLFARCHEENRDQLYVAELALDVNALLTGRGREDELSDRFIGSILRVLGFATKKLDRRGRGVAFDMSTRVEIHRLAAQYELDAKKFPGCQQCSSVQPIPAKGLADKVNV